MRKPLLIAFLAAILIGGFVLVGIARFGTVQAATNVTGIISADTTWTKANSPYTLTGNILISNGVTLIIEAGATVDLNSYYIMVNGTLRARGNMAETVQFNGGSITFTQYSANWSEAIGSGSIIENANLSTTYVNIDTATPKIDSNSVSGITVYNGSVEISNNTITNQVTVSGSPSITNNTVNGEISISSDAVSPVISYNTVGGRIYVASYSQSPIISHNTIMGGVEVSSKVNASVISYNLLSGGLNVSGISATISYNTITGGINAKTDTLTILNNTIIGSGTAISFTSKSQVSSITASVVNNTIIADDIGINIPSSFVAFLMGWWTDAIISGNTIYNCATAAIQVGGATAQSGYTLRYNNVTIQDNLIYNNTHGVNTGGLSKIEGNTIVGNDYGLIGGDPIRNNIIASNTYGIVGGSAIEGNLIINNQVGLNGGTQIRNNTIAKNSLGIESGFSTLVYNNIHDNEDNIRFTSSIDTNATYNWWGTTDTEAINQTIYDYKNDFTLGKVNFVPFLTQLNPAAPTIPTFTITASAGAGGSISPSGSVSVSYGDDQTFTVTPDSGYQIASVLMDGAPATAPYTFFDVIADGHTISATFEEVPTPTPTPTPSPSPSPSPTPTPTPTPASTQISISVDASSTAIGSAVNINGRLSDSNGNPLQDKSVTLSYAVTDSTSWVSIGSGTTNSAGEYNIQWVNTASGTFTLKAEWNGDDDYLGASATTTLSFLPYENQQVFFVESNSTVSALTFNSTSSELSFTVSGTSGTTGYVKVTIAKSLVSNAENIKVYLDGNQLNYEVTSNADSWLLTFTYTHSTHNVMISLAADEAGGTFLGIEYLILIAVVIVIAMTGVIGFLFWRKKKKT